MTFEIGCDVCQTIVVLQQVTTDEEWFALPPGWLIDQREDYDTGTSTVFACSIACVQAREEKARALWAETQRIEAERIAKIPPHVCTFERTAAGQLLCTHYACRRPPR